MGADGDRLTVSWFRAYHATRAGDAVEVLQHHVAEGRLRAVEPDPAFYDVQALRLEHVARATLPSVSVSGLLELADGRQVQLEAPVAVHLLVHASGFLVQRWTLRSDRCPQLTADVALLRALERAVWDGTAELLWSFSAAGDTVRGNVRTAMNYAYLRLHQAAWGRAVRHRELAEQAVEGPHGCDRIHELCARNEISFPWPVTFGTQVELVSSDLEPTAAAALAAGLAVAPGEAARFTPRDIEGHAEGVSWFWGENLALVLRREGGIDDVLDCIDTDRTQLAEFLDLRRATLRSIQRDTQRIMTDGDPVTRRRIEEWRQLLGSTTDDYVLHDRIGGLLVPLAAHVAADPHLRDLRTLEDQTRQNVDAFQARIDLAAQDASAFVGAVFAVVAAEPVAGMLRGLLVELGLSAALTMPSSQLGAAFDAAFVTVTAVSVWLWLRRSGRRLRGLRTDG